MTAVDDPAMLGSIVLFRNLTLEQLAQLNERLHRRLVNAGASVLSMDQPGDRIYFIHSGTLKVYVDQPDGSEFIIFIRGAGETIGEMSVLENTHPSANVVALERAVLFWMDQATFRDCLHSMPAINDNLVRMLSWRLRFTTQRLQWLSTQNVDGRVARQLLAFAEQDGQRDAAGHVLIPLRLTQSDLASFVGATRESVNKVMVAFKQKGYLSVDANYRIIIHDWAGLSAHCE